jgi:dihydropteroate synthase
LAACAQGASILRVHDVAATVDALKVWRAATLPMQDNQIGNNSGVVE